MARIDDPEQASSFPFVVRAASGLYAIDAGVDCVELEADDFRGEIWFGVNNTFSEGGTAILRVKSVRTFSIPTQASKIKVSRGRGWISLLDGSPLAELKDQPIPTAIPAWNAAHAATAPLDAAPDPIKAWHGRASPTISSFDAPDFWTFPPDIDVGDKTITTYLIRFEAGAGGFLPLFYVTRASRVTAIDIEIDSTLSVLSEQYSLRFH